MDLDAQVYQRKLQYDVEWAEQAMERSRELIAFEEQRAGADRDARLRALEASDAQTLEKKVALEQQKAQIEVEYLERVHEIRMHLFDLETAMQAADYELEMKRLGYQADVIDQRLAEYAQQRNEIRQMQQESTDEAVRAARENAAVRQGELIRDEQRRIFESLNQQAGGVFDALLTKSQSVWSAIGNSLKTALLTAIKDVVTSRVAAMLMQLLTGSRVSFAGGGGVGALGGIGGLLGMGAIPALGGTGTSLPGILPGMAGSTGAGGGGSLLSGAAWAGQWSSLKGSLASLGNLGRPVGVGSSYAGSGYGGMTGGAMLAGGGTLFAMGMQRGGWSGVGMTTAGGALIGAKFGGPVGAVIGGIVGFGAGMIRRLWKNGEEKVREKIKATYGVDISDKGILRQIVETAKQGFGGNLNVAIQSQQIRDLVELYAMTTGQKMTGSPATMRPASFVQTGGTLFESPSYQNGSMLPASSSLRVLGAGASGGAAPQPIVVKLDGPATTLLLRGEAVQAMTDNPRVVQSATMKATKANSGRREMLSLQLSPGTLTS